MPPGNKYVVAFNSSGECMSELQLKPNLREPFWPALLIPIGLGLTIVWIGMLGYGMIKLVELAI
jgi:hypothetical protein